MNSSNKFIYFLSFMSGFLSLAIEMFWIRIISFMGMTMPQAFSFALGVFLLGISIGAFFGKKICSETKVSTVSVGKIYTISSLLDIFIFYVLINLPDSPFIIYMAGALLFISMIFRGMVFPIIHHIGTEKNKTGRAISNVYFANVFGSALAPIIIGYVALDYLSTQQVYFLIIALTLLIATLTVKHIVVGIVSLSALIGTSAAAFVLPEHLIHHLAKDSYQKNVPPSFVLENKHGIVTGFNNIQPGFEDDVLIYGNNAYDGRLNTNLFKDTNAVSRSYMLASMRDNIQDVLVVGLSTGAWTKVLLQNPSVKSVTIVEINPAYLELIKSNQNLSVILSDPRVKIIVDDGRKWIRKNQDKSFDLLIMNTSFHWRAYSTNLLSAEFLKLTKGIMKPSAILYYNATNSSDVFATAKKSFKNAYQHRNMVMVSNNPISVEREAIERNLCTMVDPMSQKAIFDSPFHCYIASHLALKDPIIDLSKEQPRDLISTSHQVITDNNMRPEYHTIYSGLTIDRKYE